jgi:hypothetical protein
VTPFWDPICQSHDVSFWQANVRNSVHTISQLSQVDSRKANCARASREQLGLPRPRQSTSGEVIDKSFIAEQRISTKSDCGYEDTTIIRAVDRR